MKKLVIICAVALVSWLMASGVAQADFINEPVKWSQLPDKVNSDDLFSMHMLPDPWDLVVADDWQCTDPRAVVALRWWGSYLADEITGEYVDAAGNPILRGARHIPFEVSWHSDVPAGVDDPGTSENDPLNYSHPGGAILFDYVTAQEEIAFTDGNGKKVYVYNAWLTVPWEQEKDTIYWLDVALDPFAFGWTVDPDTDPNQVVGWGWSKAEENWNDLAIQNDGWHWAPWNDLPGAHGPGSLGDSLHDDRAFELMVPEPATVMLLGLGGLLLRRRKHCLN